MRQIHDQIIDHPGAWKAADLASKDAYAFDFTRRHRDALDAALVGVRRAGLAIDDIGRAEFPLDAIAADIAAIDGEVRHGRGLVLIRGFPVERYDLDDLETVYWGFGAHFGTAVSQSVLGDRIGHATDKSAEAASERSYRNANELTLHTDCNEMIAMLSVRTAKHGGESKYASALTVHNEMLRSHPEHMPALYEGFYYHRRGEEPPGAPPCTAHKVPVFSSVEGHVSARYVPGYLQAAAPELGIEFPAALARAMARFDATACREDIMITVLLEPGELQHAHFQDLAAGPRELINNDSRIIPSDGVAPVERIIRTLEEKGYEGALSVELFRADFVQADPFDMATEIRSKCEAVMREAGVL